MKSPVALTFSIFIILLGNSCEKSKSPPLNSQNNISNREGEISSKEAEVISKLQQDKTQPEHVREGAGIMMAVLVEKDNISIRDYIDAKRKVCTARNVATVQAWIALLNSVENKLPETLPSAEEYKQKQLESNKQKIRIVHYDSVSRLSLTISCISALASLDMPEAKNEIDAYLHRFEKKYGNSSGGKKMLELYRTERSQQEEGVRIGAAPWQVGPNPGAP